MTAGAPAGNAAPWYDSAARRGPAIDELADLVSNGPVVLALVSRNIKVRYKRSVLGFAWTMAQPATLLLVVTLIFSRAFAPGVVAYAIYVAPGLLLWYFFAQTTSAIAAEAGAGSEMWRRVRMPRTALPIATACTGLFNLVLATLALAIVLPFAQVRLGAALLTLPLTAILTTVFTLGVSLAIAGAAMHFSDASDLHQMLLLPWMFITPVIYPRAILPVKVERLIAINPVALYVDAYRAPLTANTSPTPAAFASMLAIAALSLLIGWLVFTRAAQATSYRG